MTHQCNGHELKLSQEQVDGMKKCAEVVGIKTMEEMTPDKIPCFAKCILEKSELVRKMVIFIFTHPFPSPVRIKFPKFRLMLKESHTRKTS